MRTFRIVIVDAGGSTTQDIREAVAGGMLDAITIAVNNRRLPNSVVSVTATILSTSS